MALGVVSDRQGDWGLGQEARLKVTRYKNIELGTRDSQIEQDNICCQVSVILLNVTCVHRFHFPRVHALELESGVCCLDIKEPKLYLE